MLEAALIVGLSGVILGFAVPEPAALVQPFTVFVTEYVPTLDTVIVEVLSPVLHRRLPAASVESVEVPLQLSTTVTTGAVGVVLGAAVPEPAALRQPPVTVVVTVYVPADATVIEAVVSPVLHKSEPEAVVDNVEVPLQLLTTVTTGVAGVVQTGAYAAVKVVTLLPLLLLAKVRFGAE
ncbi:hypothetical protein Q4E40_18610 [Pontibacter sp. BT731]|uniref:hypothetical protein n=1 Tax=Pontibacter coccineus TaxID=3063328 RepID=UPI0026E1E415|nr:hypothetical protein [Pontibacter sp. BT731]MDO6392154.1 hypothetical protein [Pontibacter sp. BT731]